MVTQEQLLDPENHGQCECGSYAHFDHLVSCDSGTYTCPECQVSWMSDQISMLIKMVVEVADPGISRKDLSMMLKTKYAEILGGKGTQVYYVPEDICDCIEEEVNKQKNR